MYRKAELLVDIVDQPRQGLTQIFLDERGWKEVCAERSCELDGLIEQLSAYIQSTGKKYADHAATLSIWAKRQNAEKKTAPGIPDYTFAEGESL